MGGKSRQRAYTGLGKRILVVEDEEAIREMLASMLASADYHCPAVSSGEDLSLLQSGKRFDLMLLT
jgi:CheY-like chemotaxis protein